MNIKIFLLSLAVAGYAQANISPAGFEAFPNDYFVETGTFNGQGIRYALRAQFPEIHSIELMPVIIKDVLPIFQHNEKVHIHQGDSGKMLYEIIKGFDKPITFWLDAHSDIVVDNQKCTPLLEELEQIKLHHIKTHTILIDDMHCCGTVLFDGITQEQIAEKVKEVNPEYEISYVPGGDDAEYPVNVMVARVPKSQAANQ